ncbi:maleylpyruvate isomerase N-terminal domain-containing protein [Aeromicrobium sp. UC242_57]|uniref:maleylpyruvate isomerase N-terminal domain-containing protein n=1 Tax=Aeromicrobium sp. UC242_57 TaxID=3374624 RepID=UPI0037AA9C67
MCQQDRRPDVTRARSQTLAWTEVGTNLFLKHAEPLSDEDLRAPSALPGWTLKHLLAHVASNADALSNLVEWARTGVYRPYVCLRWSARSRHRAGCVLSTSTAHR